MIKLKDEIKRVEAVKGNVVPVSKQLYLNLLKEIKLLRFKAHVANDWNLPLKEKEKVSQNYCLSSGVTREMERTKWRRIRIR